MPSNGIDTAFYLFICRNFLGFGHFFVLYTCPISPSTLSLTEQTAVPQLRIMGYLQEPQKIA